MKTKHTKGPWVVGTADNRIHSVSDGTLVAQLTNGWRDARLIAAAPELLEACIAALSQLTEERPEYLESDIEQLRAAIAKADGE